MKSPYYLIFVLAGCLAMTPLMNASAQEVNVYSARKENLIKPLLDKFSAETGINTNLITAKADKLLTRMGNEGANTPADVLITVDAGRLYRAVKATGADSTGIQQIQPGMSQQQVRLNLGTPATTAVVGGGRAYYYISSTKKQTDFLRPDETDRQGVAVCFSQAGTGGRVAYYGLEDGKTVDNV